MPLTLEEFCEIIETPSNGNRRFDFSDYLNPAIENTGNLSNIE